MSKKVNVLRRRSVVVGNLLNLGHPTMQVSLSLRSLGNADATILKREHREGEVNTGEHRAGSHSPTEAWR